MASMGKRASCRSLGRRRIYTTSYRDAIVSIASTHTETVNIWSHLLAALWFATNAARFTGAVMCLSSSSTAAVLTYLVATAFCFAWSALYHIFADHTAADFWLRLDHIGIVCAIWASSVSFVELSPGWHSTERWRHILMVTAAATICCVCLSTASLYGNLKQSFRIRTHVIMGSVAAIPALRCWHLHRPGQCMGLLADFVTMIVINGSGGAIYATNFLDERIKKKLGVPGASHQVMHVLAVVGALVYERGLMLAYFQRHKPDEDCPLWG